MSSAKKALLIVLGAALILALWVWSGYNGLVTAHANVENTWAQVETQYQRRFDLVPNLVNTVKGAAAFEQETFREVTAARSAWQGAAARGGRIAAAQELEGALARLLVTFENYPELQATQAFRDLMAQLEGSENRIAVARRDYNDAVRSYNVSVRRFPRNLLARFFGFGEETFFEAAEGSDEAPKVEF